MLYTEDKREYSDTALIEEIVNGNAKAFEYVFDKHKNSVYRFCYMMLHDEAAAQDIYQETFIAFFCACKDKKDIRSIKGWLISAARSRCIDAIRKSKRENKYPSSQSEEVDFTQFELAECLSRALEKIPPQYRETFLLFEVEGYNYNEISKLLGISTNVIKNRIYRAKIALQKILRPILFDNEGEGKRSI